MKQTGVTLVESMIALLVISIGLLGIAALQITTVSQNASALNHSQAVWIAYNMADRIRANGSQVGLYVGVDTDDDYTQGCIANGCDTAQMRDSDATDWINMMNNLPSGRGRITNNPDGGVFITVMWDDEGTGATGTNCGGDTDDLTCYTVPIQ